tara:strand:- start:2801 stop:2962 length:162 start_codon:yes stop_codon:yes gene_type:complete
MLKLTKVLESRVKENTMDNEDDAPQSFILPLRVIAIIMFLVFCIAGILIFTSV